MISSRSATAASAVDEFYFVCVKFYFDLECSGNLGTTRKLHRLSPRPSDTIRIDALSSGSQRGTYRCELERNCGICPVPPALIPECMAGCKARLPVSRGLGLENSRAKCPVEQACCGSGQAPLLPGLFGSWTHRLFHRLGGDSSTRPPAFACKRIHIIILCRALISVFL